MLFVGASQSPSKETIPLAQTRCCCSGSSFHQIVKAIGRPPGRSGKPPCCSKKADLIVGSFGHAPMVLNPSRWSLCSKLVAFVPGGKACSRRRFSSGDHASGELSFRSRISTLQPFVDPPEAPTPSSKEGSGGSGTAVTTAATLSPANTTSVITVAVANRREMMGITDPFVAA